MKKIVAIALAVVLMIALVPTAVFAGNNLNGNGVPSGAHYNLNIIGVNNRTAPKTSGNVIFVPLDTSGHNSIVPSVSNKVDIMLEPTNDGTFAVVDGNACDDDTAIFEMPQNVAITYAVYVRGLGQPNKSSNMQLWSWYVVDGVTYWTSGQQITIKSHGNNNKFQNVSSELLTLSNGDSIFDDAYEGWLWTYGNNGQRIVQLRFYPIIGN